jgi:hypothetical protein
VPWLQNYSYVFNRFNKNLKVVIIKVTVDGFV